MARYIIIFLSLLSSFAVVNAQEPKLKADSAYANTDYTTALSLYNEALDSLGSSAPLYYNIGNAYYRTGNLAQAVLFYERALRLDPTMKEAKENLEFVNSKIIDRPGERGTFWQTAMRQIALTFTSNAWAWIGLILFVLFIAGALIYYFSDSVLLRKTGFFSGIVLFILSVISIAEAFYAKSLSQASDEAIITAKSTILSTSPRTPLNSSEEAMLLHEGTKLTIMDSVVVEKDSVKTVWYDAQIDNTHRAWISSDDVEKI